MRHALSLVAVALMSACGSTGSGTGSGAQTSRPETPEQGQLAKLRQDLRQIESDLEGLRIERQEWAQRPPSASKQMREKERQHIESELKRLRDQLRNEIALLEGGSKPPEDPLAALEEMELALKSEEETALRQKEEAERKQREAEEARVRSEAEAKALAEAREKGIAPPAGVAAVPLPEVESDPSAFEEKWASVILNVKLAAQRYGR